LNVSLEKRRGLERRLTVRIPVVEIDREVSSRLVRVSRSAKLKGFRPGKIPAKVVRQRFGDQVRQEVISDTVRSSFTQALEQENLNPAGNPQIEHLTDRDSNHFSYRATFEVYPEVKLKALDGLFVEKPVVRITDADTDEMIDKLKDQKATWQSIGREAKLGDRVIVDFVGMISDQVFEGGEGTEVPIELGAGQVLEGFENALRGAVAGQSKKAKVKFPKDYPAAELGGKKAVFDITIHRVEEKILPEINDEFLDTFGIKEGGLQALRSNVTTNMERELEQRMKVEIKRRALDALLKMNNIEVPRALVEQEISSLQTEGMRRLGIEDPEKAPPRTNFQVAAERRVALALLVQNLITEQGIEVDHDRVDGRIKEITAAFDKPEEMARAYHSNRELMAQVESSILEDQVVDCLMKHAKTKNKSIEFKKFMM